jgi:hypothetical protein
MWDCVRFFLLTDKNNQDNVGSCRNKIRLFILMTAKESLDNLLSRRIYLKAAGELVFPYLWEGKLTHREIADALTYSSEYVREVSNNLYKQLEKELLISTKLQKENFRELIEQYFGQFRS